jgi:hypothetical protein
MGATTAAGDHAPPHLVLFSRTVGALQLLVTQAFDVSAKFRRNLDST